MERWWSSRLANGVAFTLGAALLECLPIAAALQLGAAAIARDPGDAALPLWALLALVLAGTLLGRGLRSQRTATLLLAAAPCWALSAALAVRLSPAGYGAVGNWLGALGRDLITGGIRLNGVIGLLLLTGYCWWRGLRLGQAPPHVERLAGILKVGLGTIILAIIAAVSVPGAAGGLLVGRLALLLPLEVFCGLACLAMAQAVVQRRAARDGAMPTAAAPWLGFALTLSGLAVALAFAFTLVLSFDRLSGAVASLGPVGAALDAGLRWLIYGVSYVIFFVFGGFINWVYHAARGRETPVRPPAAPNAHHACTSAACLPNLPPAEGIAVAIVLAVAIATVLAALTYAIYRSLSTLRRTAEDGDDWERRESLDVRALLGSQLRDLLAGLVPHATPATPLPEGSVRRLYQSVLAAAERAGSGRQPAETPDEYAARLAASARGAEGSPDAAAEDVRALTAAYKRVRYADTPDAREDHSALRAAARRLIARLRER
jgi:hypothetical protein